MYTIGEMIVADDCYKKDWTKGVIFIPKKKYQHPPIEDFLNLKEEGDGKRVYLLEPGESAEYTEGILNSSLRGGMDYHRRVVKNIGGVLIEEEHPDEKKKRKEFAVEQVRVAHEQFCIKEETIWKILRVCGPGALLQALEYGKELIAKMPKSQDGLLVILNQAGPGKTQLGLDRATAVLKEFGLPLPNYRNSNNFFKILLGARKAIHLCLIKGEYT